MLPVIVAVPTLSLGVAVVVALPAPPKPAALPAFSPVMKPLTVVVSAGLVAPYRRLWLSAVTVR